MNSFRQLLDFMDHGALACDSKILIWYLRLVRLPLTAPRVNDRLLRSGSLGVWSLSCR